MTSKLNPFELRDYWERLSWLLAYYWDGKLSEVAKAIKLTKPVVEHELSDLTILPAVKFAQRLAKAAEVDWEWLSTGVGVWPPFKDTKLPTYCYIGCQTSAPEGVVDCEYAYCCIDRAFIQKMLRRIQGVAAAEAGDLQYHVFSDYSVTFTGDLAYAGLADEACDQLQALLDSVDVSGSWFLMPVEWEPTDDNQPEAARIEVSHLYAGNSQVFFEGLPKNANGTVDTHHLNPMQLLWLANCLKDRDTRICSLGSLPVQPVLPGMVAAAATGG